MSWFARLGGALVDCISKPVDALCEWAKEPLEVRRHERTESSKTSSHSREVELQESRIKLSQKQKLMKKRLRLI